jgi:hypothetical protein
MFSSFLGVLCNNYVPLLLTLMKGSRPC